MLDPGSLMTTDIRTANISPAVPARLLGAALGYMVLLQGSSGNSLPASAKRSRRSGQGETR